MIQGHYFAHPDSAANISARQTSTGRFERVDVGAGNADRRVTLEVTPGPKMTSATWGGSEADTVRFSDRNSSKTTVVPIFHRARVHFSSASTSLEDRGSS